MEGRVTAGGGDQNQTALEGGGAKYFGRVAKGGRKILDALQRGGEKFWTWSFFFLSS